MESPSRPTCLIEVGEAQELDNPITGEQLRSAREQINLSLFRLSTRTGIPFHTLNDFERTGLLRSGRGGIPTVKDRFVKLRQVLEIASAEYITKIANQQDKT